MAKPKWITLGTAEGSMNGSSEITAAAYTGRVAREGTITGTTAGGASDTTAVSQVGAAEAITIETKTYSADKVGQNITIQGKSNSADLNIVVGDSTIPGLVYKLAVAGVTDESWNGNDDISVDGDPGASAMYDFTLTVTVPENKSESARVAKFAVKNANADVTSGEITINQAAGVKNYAVPIIITFSYDANIPASGGSVSPTLNYMQKWGWNESDSNGGSISDHTPAAGVTSFKGGSSTNKDTGVVTASSKGTVESGITEVDNVTLVVTLNGKDSAPRSVSVKQAANAASYGDVSFSSRVPSVDDIPASGGSVDKADIIWSGEGAIVTQKITYSSGAEVTISDEDGSTDPAFNPIHIAYGDPITAASKGTAVSARTEAGVITMIADGAGDKTATKTLTVYQAANSATYGEGNYWSGYSSISCCSG